MVMAMMDVWVMRMRVNQADMSMQVAMRFADWRLCIMIMLMVFVVDVKMVMDEFLMRMEVLMAFRQMKPDTNTHQQTGGNHPNRNRLSEQDNRDGGSNERCR
jgi:hypothetical protein